MAGWLKHHSVIVCIVDLLQNVYGTFFSWITLDVHVCIVINPSYGETINGMCFQNKKYIMLSRISRK